MPTPRKVDYKKDLEHLYQPPATRVVEVDVPELQFLMIDGEGDPNGSQAFADATEALFSLSYTLKFTVKKSAAVDYGVMPLEGLWWADDMAMFSIDGKSNWKWTLLIMQPDVVSPALVAAAVKDLAWKKDLAALAGVRFEAFAEGTAAQTLHVGPFSTEGPTVERVHGFIADAGRNRTGKHHEIYLSDIRRADPAKWKTVVRQPMK